MPHARFLRVKNEFFTLFLLSSLSLSIFLHEEKSTYFSSLPFFSPFGSFLFSGYLSLTNLFFFLLEKEREREILSGILSPSIYLSHLSLLIFLLFLSSLYGFVLFSSLHLLLFSLSLLSIIISKRKDTHKQKE